MARATWNTNSDKEATKAELLAIRKRGLAL
jgi:hypothetical protein